MQRLTILETYISNTSRFDFFTRQKPQSYTAELRVLPDFFERLTRKPVALLVRDYMTEGPDSPIIEANKYYWLV